VNYLDESNIYENIRATVTEAQKKVYSTVNFVMVETYWNIGKRKFQCTYSSQLSNDKIISKAR
jgi:hypothetical protein